MRSALSRSPLVSSNSCPYIRHVGMWKGSNLSAWSQKSWARSVRYAQVLKQDLFMCPKRPVYVTKETYSYGKRDLLGWQKRLMYTPKETYWDGKRDLLGWQKRPIYVAKETDEYGKRDLFIWQKRPVHMAKEAYGD